jgi:ubiquinone/menaquinone biosynthesis C-methylase UbiE
MMSGREEIREAYRDDRVARQYVGARFVEPLGAALHARQAQALTRLIRAHRPRRVLEIAPGPARLTVDVSPVIEGQAVIVEASAQMLAEARRRLAPANGRWRFLQGDAFHLPLGPVFDLVYVFRLIRHFEAPERAELYRQIARVVRPGGRLMFDAVNEAVSAPLRACAYPGEFAHYDALMRPDVLAAELAGAGFEVTSLEGVQCRYTTLTRIQTLVAPRSRGIARLAIELTDRFGGGEPLEWIVTCRRV